MSDVSFRAEERLRGLERVMLELVTLLEREELVTTEEAADLLALLAEVRQ